MDNTGLKQAEIDGICSILKRYPNVEEAILFGSRAMGNHQPASDIDLSLKGKGITLSQIGTIENQIDDMLMPYTMDINIYSELDNEDLINHINRVGKQLYVKA